MEIKQTIAKLKQWDQAAGNVAVTIIRLLLLGHGFFILARSASRTFDRLSFLESYTETIAAHVTEYVLLVYWFFPLFTALCLAYLFRKTSFKGVALVYLIAVTMFIITA
ncbi:hypothetical protein HCH_03583 [Hahella chejuensis KCTC 2396]|uniref:Uncharacterized protein n=1 Tax=Hahella chejuensis (strain KCTC 2396) TaxID=349521 RepID=Q2SG99_HAHCH|nr:hypothetical protein HCH_03583 [Hahella chejuensis KCTC 2396]